jgi:N-acetylneuraminate synthase/N,N'-diacetyllegionaminate synthase
MDEFDIPIGYSDHSIGMDAIETAVAMGAEIIEVHFTDERKGKKFRDHMISATKDEIASLINKINKIKILQGSFDKKPVKSEIDSGHVKSFRRGIYAKKELQVGDIINEDSLITLRPLVGCGAEDFYNLIGTRVLTDKVALEKLDK